MISSDTWNNLIVGDGRYQVIEKLGAGGMGAVYHAHDERLDCDVVIKVPHRHMLEDETFAARFRREIRALVSLSHPHVVKILDVGDHEGLPFAVMQYLGGGSLEDRTTSGKPVDPASLAEWLPDVAKAMDFIHRKGFVHRDIKPANIFFDDEGIAYVGDFGIAKVVSDANRETQTEHLTGTGLAMGTVDYMAPEVLLNEPYDGRVDQYALAVMLCEMLAGRRPYRATTPVAVIAEKVTMEPTKVAQLRSGLPSALTDAIDRSMSKDPKRRFSTCTEFAEVVFSTPKSDPPVVRLSCPSCRRTLRLKPKVAGKSVPCPNCSVLLTVAADLSKLHGSTPSPVSPPQPNCYSSTDSTRESVSSAVSPPTQTRPPFSTPFSKPLPSAETPTEEYNNSLGMKFCLIPAGKFIMGRPKDDEHRDDSHKEKDGPHCVCITKPYYLGVQEVTQGQWLSLMGTTPWKGEENVKEGPEYPTTYVSWNDVQAFLTRLSSLEDREYRLCTEAEWEYACRAGMSGAYFFGDDLSRLREYAWYDENAYGISEDFAHRVAQKKANNWGLSDMHGNVWEWCDDKCEDNSNENSITTDPTGPSSGVRRALRGGSWRDCSWNCRVSIRFTISPDFRGSDIGFRVVLEPTE